MTTPAVLYTAAQVRELDRRAIEDYGIDGYDLMARAGEVAFRTLRRRWPGARRLAIACGGGNNGGDGLVVARLAHAAGLEVEVALHRDPERLTGAAAHAWADWAAIDGHASALDAVDWARADVVVDALLGTGLDRAVSGPIAGAIEAIKAARVPVLAVDIPSGLDADTGTVLGHAVAADATATFIGAKRGLYTGAAPDWTGPVLFDDLAVPAGVYAGVGPAVDTVGVADTGQALPRRRPGAHKGDAGHLLIVGGDYGLAGAALMASEAALRCGAGLVTLATRGEHAAVVAGARPEVMAHAVEEPARELKPFLAQADAVAVGPGLGTGPWGEAALAAVLGSPVERRVFDADALNLLARAGPQALGSAVLTPHPGEAGRLLGLDTQRVQADRFAALDALIASFGCAVVLKGPGTLIGGDGRTRLLPGARPAMASGGMGDVLTGVIASLQAQGMAATQAATAGACLHAEAADRAVGRVGAPGMIAGDLMAPLASLRDRAVDG
jgi:NAD(P)H-hydrate epimerase